MSIAPFARIESRVNAAALRHLANAEASWHGGEPFGVIFDSGEGEAVLPGVPITAERCTVSLCVANCPGIAEGVEGLVINGIAYRVASAVVPDAGGWASFSVVQE